MNNIEIVNNFRALHINSNYVLWYRRGSLYISRTIREKPVLLGQLPLTMKQRFLCKFRLAERLLRLEPRTAVEIGSNQYIISVCGFIARVNINTGEITREHRYRKGMNNTMNFCKIEGIDGFDDCTVYGEYWGNNDREEVCIYSRKNNRWSKVFAFPKGSVLHIHSIAADPFRGGVIILTGDSDHESGIWMARYNFKAVEPLLIGSQNYRACCAFPIRDGILYATDSPLKDNFIALAVRELNGWEEKVQYPMPGPCIYAAKYKDTYIFSTSVEPDSSITGTRYMITYRLGKGVKDRYTHVIAGNCSAGFKELARFKKDVYPMLLFQFGNIQFSGCSLGEEVVMNPVGVKNYDGKTIILKQIYMTEAADE